MRCVTGVGKRTFPPRLFLLSAIKKPHLVLGDLENAILQVGLVEKLFLCVLCGSKILIFCTTEDAEDTEEKL
jgi:hypothetical protein